MGLKYKKPVIPLRVDADAELPFRLSSRQYIDFSGGFEAGLAKLRLCLGGMGSPEWVLQDLRSQLTEAERELPRADPARRSRVEQDIGELRARVAAQERLLADPGAATRRTEERIAAGLERERQPERPSAAPARAKFVNTPPVVAPGYFQDRHVESELVGDFLRADDARIMTVVGRSGARSSLARICLLVGDLSAAQQAAVAARGHDYPPDRARLSLLLGIVQLRQDQPAEAAREFGSAITEADELLQHQRGRHRHGDPRAVRRPGRRRPRRHPGRDPPGRRGPGGNRRTAAITPRARHRTPAAAGPRRAGRGRRR